MNVQAISDFAIRGSPGRAQPVEPMSSRSGAESAPFAPAAAAGRPEPSPEEVAKAVEGVNAFLGSSNSHIQFAVHQATKRMMVEVINNDTQEIIKTIPSKELLDLAAKIGELVGTVLDRKG
jgi:flagellar protein FlaG